MKKKMLLLGMAGMMLLAPMSAGAETTLTKVGSLQESDWVDGTNLLKVYGNGGYALATMDGTALTENNYSSSFYYERGYITAYANSDELNREGLFDLNGKEIMPFQYGDIKMRNTSWALGFVLEEATSSQYDCQMAIIIR